jgi:Tfp pilus assembly protein PilF
MMGGIGLLVLIGAAMTLPRLFGGSTPKFTAPNPAAAPRPAPRSAKPAAKPPASTRVVPTDPAELAKAISAGLATGQARMDANDPAAAILAFNDVLVMDPGNATAKAGISTAGERYKATKAEREALNTIKLAFRDGEFTSALRLAYRLPPTVSKSYSDGVKVAGWYNLAIVALRAGDCREAMTHLDEALQVDGSDHEVKTLREFASRYADTEKDRTFLDHVEALSFRPVPES